MTNRLTAIVPVMFHPSDPGSPIDPALEQDGRAENLTAVTAISLAVLVVGLIAVLMGMT